MTTIRNCISSLLRINFTRCLKPNIVSSHFCTVNPQNVLTPHPNCIKKLQSLFDLKKSTAFNLLHDNTKFAKVSANEIDDNFNVCINAGIKKEILLKHFEVLTVSDISEKIELLKNLPYNLNVTLPLLGVNMKLLTRLVTQEQNDNRIQVLSKSLEIVPEQVCYLISIRTHLITLDIKHLKRCFVLLSRFGITKQEIIKDLWVLKYTTENIESRLQFAKDSNVEKVKTWMVRVPPETFENSIRRHSDNKIILGKNSLIEYLSNKLQCPQELIKYIIYKHPAIESKNLRKMTEMIEFLLSKGFTTEHICKTPKILLHRKNTIADRLKLLEDHGKQLSNLSVLTKSYKQFMQFVITTENNKKCKTV